MKKIIGGAVVCIILLASIVGYNYVLSENTGEENKSSISMESKSQKTYEHTFPEQVVKSDFFAGEFIRNDVASIYPRRQSLVKDILVDIGDEVYVGQTLAVLFEPGVEGQSVSNIGLKSTIVESQSKLLSDTKKVRDAKLIEFDAKLQEKQILLEETLNNYNAKIALIGEDSEDIGTQYSVAFQKLETLKSNLKNAQESQSQVLIDAEKNISQKADLLSIKIEEVYTSIIPMLYIGEESHIDYEQLRKGDLHNLFSVRNTSIVNTLVFAVQKYQTERETLSAGESYSHMEEILELLALALESTTASLGDISQDTIEAYISDLKNLDTALQNSKEIYDDTLTQLELVKASQVEKISQIENKIIEQEQSIALINSSLTSLESEKVLQIEKIKSELETLKKSRDLLIANEDRGVTQAENNVSIARADLNKEYVASGNYKIISPFSGIISKRDIEIGKMISPSKEAFRVSGVDNSLSRITKQEIKFFVPENLQDQIELEQEVYFSTANESKSFTGTVYRISPEIDSDTRSITVQAKVDESIVLSNKSSIRVTLKSETLIYKIPTSSIYNKDERKIVYYKKDNGKLGVKDIIILSDDGEYSLISGDFDATLKVVTTPIFVK